MDIRFARYIEEIVYISIFFNFFYRSQRNRAVIFSETDEAII